MRTLFIAAVLLTLPWLAGCGQQGDGNKDATAKDKTAETPKPPKPPEITLAALSVDDAVKKVNDYPGKIVVVDTWATY